MRLSRGLSLAALAVALAFVAHAYAYGDYIDDDAGITFAYARNAVAGHGLTVNPGDPPVEGYSNPTWTALLGLTMAMGAFHWLYTPKLLGGLAGLLSLACAALVAARLSGRRLEALHLLAPAVLAGNASFVVWATSGLENGLYVGLLMAMLLAWLRHRERPGVGTAALVVAVVLSRPEAIGYAGLVALDALALAAARRTLRPWLGFGFAVLGSLAIYAAWHAATFADPLPNTYYAKVEDERLRPLEGLSTFSRGGWRYVRNGFSDWNLHWALAGLAALWLPTGRQARAVPLLTAAALWSVVYIALTGGDWMMEYRFLSPAFALFATVGAAGLVCGRDWLQGSGFGPAAGRFPGPGLSRLAMAAGGLVILASLAPLPQRLAAILAKPTMPLARTRGIADRMSALGARLGVDRPVVIQGALGGPALESNGRVVWIDAFGLTDRTVAHCFHDDCPREELWRYAFEERGADITNLPLIMAKRWRVLDAPQFEGFVPTQKATGGAGIYVRRTRLEAAGPHKGEVLPGELRIESARVVGVEGEQTRVEIVFLLGEGRTDTGVVATLGSAPPNRFRLLNLVDPSQLEVGVRYVDRPLLPGAGTALTVRPREPAAAL